MNELEDHHFLPSGAWEGFYCYGDSPAQHKMLIDLTFKNGKLSGGGIDDVEPFTWRGSYNLVDLRVKMIKNYSKHTIDYKGDIDENGIWGMWKSLTDLSKVSPELIKIIHEKFQHKIRGGFHIWPKKMNVEQNKNKSELEKKESSILTDLYIKRIKVV